MKDLARRLKMLESNARERLGRPVFMLVYVKPGQAFPHVIHEAGTTILYHHVPEPEPLPAWENSNGRNKL